MSGPVGGLVLAGVVGYVLAGTPAAHASPLVWGLVTLAAGCGLGRWLEAAR